MPQTDILTRPSREPDYVLRWGDHEEQVADLRLPRREPASRRAETEADGPAGAPPLVIFLHGGFWRSAYDRGHVGPLGDALAAAGFVVCTPEFRRTGQPGGGWPGTFDDVASAVDVLPELVSEFAAIGRVVVAGHSAGGHLALWTAGRVRLPGGTPWHLAASPAVGVVSLAGVCDLAAGYRLELGGGAVQALMGGGPSEFAGRYAAGDPMGLVPSGVAVRLVHGTEDDRVPVGLSRDYAARAVAAGDDVRCDLLEGYGHFELIDPESEAWPVVLEAFWSAAG
jgi:acetyl esterase/lipase